MQLRIGVRILVLLRYQSRMESSMSARHIRPLPLVGISVALGGLLILAGCSSTATSSIDTTATTHPNGVSTPSHIPPAPPNAIAVAASLQSPQNAVLAFERATKALGSGSVPSKSTCQAIATAVRPGSGADPNAVTTAIKGIPNTALQLAIAQDVQAKLQLLSACAAGPVNAKTAASAQSTASIVQQELQQVGVTP